MCFSSEIGAFVAGMELPMRVPLLAILARAEPESKMEGSPMEGSIKKTVFSVCGNCHGHGMVRRLIFVKRLCRACNGKGKMARITFSYESEK